MLRESNSFCFKNYNKSIFNSWSFNSTIEQQIIKKEEFQTSMFFRQFNVNATIPAV